MGNERRPALLFPVDDVMQVDTTFPVELQNLQDYVGGLIEVISLPAPLIAMMEEAYEVKLGRRAALVANDDAIALGLPVNHAASILYSLACGQPAVIMGPAVVCDVP